MRGVPFPRCPHCPPTSTSTTREVASSIESEPCCGAHEDILPVASLSVDEDVGHLAEVVDLRLGWVSPNQSVGIQLLHLRLPFARTVAPAPSRKPLGERERLYSRTACGARPLDPLCDMSRRPRRRARGQGSLQSGQRLVRATHHLSSHRGVNQRAGGPSVRNCTAGCSAMISSCVLRTATSANLSLSPAASVVLPDDTGPEIAMTRKDTAEPVS